MYASYYKKLKLKVKSADDKIYVLSQQELAELKRTERKALFISALIGAVMVLLLYLPQYYFSNFFGDSKFRLPLLDMEVEFSVTSFVYGMILVFLEIVLLTFLHIHSVHHIAAASGFIDEKSKYDTDKQHVILNVGKEKKDKKILQLGINPFQGLSKKSVFVLNLLFTLKATLSNLFVRIVVKRVLGRYAVREVLDMLGIPIFAFWNAYSTHKVLGQTRVIIMGNNLMEELKNKLPKLQLSEEEKSVVYDTLQFVSMNKRDFHDNHYFLSKTILEFYSIAFKAEHLCSPNYADCLAKQNDNVKKLCEFILIIGFILDGQISWREKKKINMLHQNKLFSESLADVKSYATDFKNGKGIEGLEKKYLDIR